MAIWGLVAAVFWNASPEATRVKDREVALPFHPLVALLSWVVLPAWVWGGPVASAEPQSQWADLMPCPVAAGWRLERQLELPRHSPDGQAIGGFSAARFNPATGRLLLLSDAPQASLLEWSGIAGNSPRLRRVLPLQRPQQQSLDGEAMVLLAGQLWVASEGRRTADRPAQLLRYQGDSGRLLQTLELPADWQPGEGRGLESNAGPESLDLLPTNPATQGQGPALLMAAERPLLQDPPTTVRLLRWQWPVGADLPSTSPVATPQGGLQLPGKGWGLTDLLVVAPDRLLALLRRFEPPFHWQIVLVLYPLPAPDAPAAAPLATWDLIATGLSPDNWEGLSPGPSLSDGRPTLLLVSDDNFNPWQANRLALISPNRTTACPPEP
jgi:hypothetical protein